MSQATPYIVYVKKITHYSRYMYHIYDLRDCLNKNKEPLINVESKNELRALCTTTSTTVTFGESGLYYFSLPFLSSPFLSFLRKKAA